MQNDELRDDTLEEVIEDTESQDEVLSEDSEVTTEESEDTDWKAEATKWKAIAKRNKQKLANPTAPTGEKGEINNAPVLTREEAILVASGYSGEDLDQLNLVARGAGISIAEAKEHPIFKAYIEKVDAEKKAKRAKLGTSRGSSSQKPVQLAGMTKEEHQKYWASRMGQ